MEELRLEIEAQEHASNNSTSAGQEAVQGTPHGNGPDVNSLQSTLLLLSTSSQLRLMRNCDTGGHEKADTKKVRSMFCLSQEGPHRLRVSVQVKVFEVL